jgi:ABC-type sugar transport system substrate-binding protein
MQKTEEVMKWLNGAQRALIGIGLAGVLFTSVAHGQDARTVRMAYSVDVLDDTQNAALQVMLKRLKELNATRKDLRIQFDVYDAQSSVDKQLSDVQTALIKKPDVLIFSAVDSVGSLPAAQAAKDAGVKVIDRRPTNPEPPVFDVTFYAYDESRYAAATTGWIKKYLNEHPSIVLNIGLIYGAPAQTAQLQRCDTIKALAAQVPNRIKIVVEGYGNWLTATAQNLAQDWLLSHPDMNYIAAANDIMALGASNALISAGRTDVLVSGYDLTSDGVQRVKDGTQSLTVGTSLDDNGQVVDVALGLVEGTFKDKTYYINPVYAVDKSNVEDFLASHSKK